MKSRLLSLYLMGIVSFSSLLIARPNVSTNCIQVRTGACILTHKIESTWKALTRLADEHPDEYRLILLCLAQQCDQALKHDKVCKIKLYGSFQWMFDPLKTDILNNLQSLGITDENNIIDKDSCHIIRSSFSGTLYPPVKGGGVRIPMYFPLQPELIHPQATFFSKLPGYDRMKAYKPHLNQNN